jgi:hypothetical protein
MYIKFSKGANKFTANSENWNKRKIARFKIYRLFKKAKIVVLLLAPLQILNCISAKIGTFPLVKKTFFVSTV